MSAAVSRSHPSPLGPMPGGVSSPLIGSDHLERIRDARDHRAFVAGTAVIVGGIGCMSLLLMVASALLKAVG